MMIGPNFVHMLFLGLCLVVSSALAEELFEPLCPLEYSLLLIKDGSDAQVAQRHRTLQQQQTTTALSPIEILRQEDDYVEFVVQNTTSFGNMVPDDLFVALDLDAFRSQQCSLHDDLGPADAEGSSTDVKRAHCFDTPRAGRIAIVRIFVRSYEGGPGNARIPACCHDPLADVASAFDTVEYVYELLCTASCDDPDNYYDDDDDDDETTEPPTGTAAPTGFPTQEPSSDDDETTEPPTGTAAPTGFPTQEPSSEGSTSYPTQEPSSEGFGQRNLLRDSER